MSEKPIYEALAKKVLKLDSVELELEKTVELLKDEIAWRQRLVESSNDGIVVVDQDCKVYETNRRFADMLGYSMDETLQLHVWDWDTVFSKEQLQTMAMEIDDQGHFFETRHCRKDGSFIDVELSNSCINYRGQKLIFCIVRDITERKKAEKSLQNAHNLMKYVIEHHRSAIAIHDKDLKYLYVSQRYLNDTRVEEKDIIGKHCYDVFPDLPQRWRDIHKRALAGEVLSGNNDPHEGEGGNTGGSWWECRPWYGENGAIGGIIFYTGALSKQELER